MTPSSRRWASLLLLCMALFVARGANAADTAKKFLKLIPNNPDAQARIAARNDAAEKLYQSFYGTKQVNWRMDPQFLHALHEMERGQAAKPDTSKLAQAQVKPGAFANRRDVTQAKMKALIERRKAGLSVPSVVTAGSSKPVPAATTGVPGTLPPSTNFGGFLGDVPSYQFNQPLDSVGQGKWSMTMTGADLNNDGYVDVINVLHDGDLTVSLNDGHGGFLPPVINKGGEQYIQNHEYFFMDTVWVPGCDEDLYGITVGDLNGDGLPDLVLMRWSNYWFESYLPDSAKSKAQLLVYMNQGNGKFSDPIAVRASSWGNWTQPTGIIIEDRNGDGKGDIVVIAADTASTGPSPYYNAISVQTLYGNGDGTFNESSHIAQYQYPNGEFLVPQNGAQFVTLAGTRYLAISGLVYGPQVASGGAVLFFQDLGGSQNSNPVADTPAKEVDFGSLYGFTTSYSNGLSLADVNGDGLPDITLSFGDYYLYGALGTPDGGFSSPHMVEDGNWPFTPVGWALADVNGDGYPDLIDQDWNYTAIWLGRGDGTFADPKEFYVNSYAYNSLWGLYGQPGDHLVAADLDHDGILDFTTNTTNNTEGESGLFYPRLGVFKGRGDGTFAGAIALPAIDQADLGLCDPLVADVTGDGLSDVLEMECGAAIPTEPTWGWLDTAINDGMGHFHFVKKALPMGAGGFMYDSFSSVGDFNLDGKDDVVLNGYVNGDYWQVGEEPAPFERLAVALSNGDGTFSNPIQLPPTLTADGNPIKFEDVPSAVVVGDINNDGKLDIVAAYRGSRYGWATGFNYRAGVLVALGNGDGSFQQPIFTPLQDRYNPDLTLSFPQLKDFNGDGYLDLLISDGTKYVMFPGGPTGFAFDQPTQLLSKEETQSAANIVAADFNNDGKQDLAVSYDGLIEIYLNQGDGTLIPISSRSGVPWALSLVAADFNGDGCVDLYASPYLNNIGGVTNTNYGGQLLLGNCNGTLQQPGQGMMIPPGTGVWPGKFTANGAPGLIGRSSVLANYPYILVNQGGVRLSLTTSNASITQGNSVSLTALVEADLDHRPVPTGNVNFYDNGTVFAAQPVNNGTASFSTSTFAAGSHLISISYTGDQNFNPQSQQLGPQINVTVTGQPAAPAAQPQIEISSPVSSLNLHWGDSQTVTLNLASKGNYTGTVKLSAVQLSAGDTSGVGVDVSPATVSLTNGGSAKVSIRVIAKSAAMARARSFPRWMGMTLGATAFGVFFLVPARRRKAIGACMLIVLCVTGLCLMSVSCGGNGSSHKAVPAVSTTVVVSATPSVAGAAVQTKTFTVTVQ